MKRIVILIAMPFLFACSSEDAKDCKCGLVLSDNVTDYSVVIRNACSGKEKKFILQPGDWINAQVGSNYCITNATPWKISQSKRATD
jgi:hypothetical protein